MNILTTPETCTIWLPDAKFTRNAGKSLASTLYRHDITIGLSGELGAGKTTFLQGFFEELGIKEHITSPTYALEQRYESRIGQLIHIDLYRLHEGKADRFLEEADNENSLRCIEWIEQSTIQPDVSISLADENDGRTLSATFNDITIPDDATIAAWQKEVQLTDHVIAHCCAVATLCTEIAELVQKQGKIVRTKALYAAALSHDLLRFIDFAPGGSFDGNDVENPAWEQWKQKYEGNGHEKACAEFLREHGYSGIADIVEPHGLKLPSPQRNTIEQKILFYADKRVRLDEVVTLEERFEDFRNRYNNGNHSESGDIWFKEAKAVEQELGLTSSTE